MTDAFSHALAQCPLVAILRGIRPGEVDAIGEVLVEAGFSLIEVPLNSPDPFDSIERLARRVGGQAVIGAGTVLEPRDVRRTADAGGRIIVSPNGNADVITAAVTAGMASLPGYFTPTEAFAALAAGATALKLFPAEAATPAMLKAHRAILPASTRLLVVGGVQPETMGPWIAAGATGFGLGSALYRPGTTPAEVETAARAFIDAWRAC